MLTKRTARAPRTPKARLPHAAESTVWGLYSTTGSIRAEKEVVRRIYYNNPEIPWALGKAEALLKHFYLVMSPDAPVHNDRDGALRMWLYYGALCAAQYIEACACYCPLPCACPANCHTLTEVYGVPPRKLRDVTAALVWITYGTVDIERIRAIRSECRKRMACTAHHAPRTTHRHKASHSP